MNALSKITLVAIAIGILMLGETGLCDTIHNILDSHDVPLPADDVVDMDPEIANCNIKDTADSLCIAFYPHSDSNSFGDTLGIGVFDKRQKVWMFKVFNIDELTKGKPYSELGSILRLECSKEHIYVVTHLTPSASLTCMFTHKLELHEILFGWILAYYEDGTVIYRKSRVHFAPTHPAEIYIYDPHAKVDRRYYPMKPYQEIRRNHIAKVRTAYEQVGWEWFARNNHHMDPELFDSHVKGKVEVNDETRSMAFVIAFNNRDCWSQEDRTKDRCFHRFISTLRENGITTSVPASLFISLQASLAEIRRRENLRDTALNIFEKEPQLRRMVQDALENENENGLTEREFFIAVNKAWENPEVWQKLRKVLAMPPRYTEVLCVFRNVYADKKPSYRTMLLRDFRKAYGDVSLSDCLKPKLLKGIFKHENWSGDRAKR